MDEDIIKFQLSDIKSEVVNTKVSDKAIEEAQISGGSDLQCLAINSPDNLSKRKQCGQARVTKFKDKGVFGLCSRHSLNEINGKILTKVSRK